MLHPFRADKPIRQLLDISRLPAEYHYFEAILMIEMGVQRRNDDVVAFVLEIRKLFRQQTSVMIVNQGDGAHDEGVGTDNG